MIRLYLSTLILFSKKLIKDNIKYFPSYKIYIGREFKEESLLNIYKIIVKCLHLDSKLGPHKRLDFKSNVSTNSTIQANLKY